MWIEFHSVHLSNLIYPIRCPTSKSKNYLIVLKRLNGSSITTVLKNSKWMYLDCTRVFLISKTGVMTIVPMKRPWSWYEHRMKTILVLTPTRPVDNVIIATKGLQDRNINIIAGTTVENKGKLILTEIFPSVQKHDIFLVLS